MSSTTRAEQALLLSYIRDLSTALSTVQIIVSRIQPLLLDISSSEALLRVTEDLNGVSLGHTQQSSFSNVGDSKVYAVIVGRNPGIFIGSTDITSNVMRVSGGHATKCNSKEEAEKVFLDALDGGLVERVQIQGGNTTRTTLSHADFPSLSVD